MPGDRGLLENSMQLACRFEHTPDLGIRPQIFGTFCDETPYRERRVLILEVPLRYADIDRSNG